MSGNNHIRKLIVPEVNAREAALVEGVEVYPVKSLMQVVQPDGLRRLRQRLDRVNFDAFDQRCLARIHFGHDQLADMVVSGVTANRRCPPVRRRHRRGVRA